MATSTAGLRYPHGLDIGRLWNLVCTGNHASSSDASSDPRGDGPSAVLFAGPRRLRIRDKLDPGILSDETFSGTATATVEVSPTPAISGLTGRIVFTRAGGAYGDETTFVARIDGSNEVQIGNRSGSCCPWALPDGSLLIRAGNTEDGRLDPVISNLDGSDARSFPLPDGLQFGSGPLSPDGTRVVLEGFTAPDFKEAATYIANVDGSRLRALTKEHFIPGDFSPDSKSVLLFRGQPGEPPPPRALWLVGADGRNLRQLTPADIKVQCCFNFRWSPDGLRILFASPDGDLWTIAPDGSDLTEVFHEQGHWAVTPTWSPDGSMILFALDSSPDPFAHPTNSLHVIRADGSGLTLVLGGSDFKREPTWVND
jgi:Tol biopolymer transport system component